MALRAGSVGLGCEAGLGSRRGWWSNRPVALLSPPPEARCARAPFPRCGPAGPRRVPPFPSRLVRAGRGVRARGRHPSAPRRWRCPSAAARKAGRSEGAGYGGLAAATLDARRALLADLPSYGARRERPPRGGASPAGRLGWRLAADLELVRTRGIRLFN